MPSMTITTDATQAQRVAAAVGARLNLKDANNLPRSATLAEVTAYTVDFLRRTVQGYERQQQIDAIQNATFDPVTS